MHYLKRALFIVAGVLSYYPVVLFGTMPREVKEGDTVRPGVRCSKIVDRVVRLVRLEVLGSRNGASVHAFGIRATVFDCI